MSDVWGSLKLCLPPFIPRYPTNADDQYGPAVRAVMVVWFDASPIRSAGHPTRSGVCAQSRRYACIRAAGAARSFSSASRSCPRSVSSKWCARGLLAQGENLRGVRLTSRISDLSRPAFVIPMQNRRTLLTFSYELWVSISLTIAAPPSIAQSTSRMRVSRLGLRVTQLVYHHDWPATLCVAARSADRRDP